MYLNNPEYVKIGEKKYKINTDFMVAIECDAIARESSIGEYERALAIIYKLFGDEGLNDFENHQKLLELAIKYLSCGEEIKEQKKDEKKDFDYKQDFRLIKASFISDYGIDLEKKKMHWWDFYMLLNGLSCSELGNCCILNKIRDIRTRDPKEIKDKKERDKLIEAKKRWALKDEKQPNAKQRESIENLKRIIGRM